MQVRRDKEGVVVDTYPSWIPLFVVIAGIILMFLVGMADRYLNKPTLLEECTLACGPGNVHNFSNTTCTCK